MSAIDFDESHYTQRELEALLNLHAPYTAADLREQLAKSVNGMGSADPNQLSFMERAAAVLGKTALSPAEADAYFHLTPTALDKAVTVSANDVIVHPTTPYTQNEGSQFFQGTINPINKRILRNNLNIDTRFRQNYHATSPSDFHMDLPTRLVNVVSLQLASLELPDTIYTVSASANNNRMTLRRDGTDPFTVVVPDGNYTEAALITTVNGILFSDSMEYADVVMTVDRSTRQTVFTAPVDPFSLDFNDVMGPCTDTYVLSMRLGWMLGFREATYESQTAFASEGLLDLTGPRYFYLVVDEFASGSVNDGFTVAFQNSVLNKNILARITVRCGGGCVSESNFSVVTTPRQYFGGIVIQKLRVQLLDAYGRPVNLNRADYSLCLNFQTAYNL